MLAPFRTFAKHTGAPGARRHPEHEVDVQGLRPQARAIDVEIALCLGGLSHPAPRSSRQSGSHGPSVAALTLPSPGPRRSVLTAGRPIPATFTSRRQPVSIAKGVVAPTAAVQAWRSWSYERTSKYLRAKRAVDR